MADYIDGEELRKLFKQRIFVWSSKDNKLLMGKNEKWVDALSELPSVDAVVVVRCRDCKHRHNDFCYKLSIIDDKQNSYYLVVNDDDFCKWGEKNE